MNDIVLGKHPPVDTPVVGEYYFMVVFDRSGNSRVWGSGFAKLIATYQTDNHPTYEFDNGWILHGDVEFYAPACIDLKCDHAKAKLLKYSLDQESERMLDEGGPVC